LPLKPCSIHNRSGPTNGRQCHAANIRGFSFH